MWQHEIQVNTNVQDKQKEIRRNTRPYTNVIAKFDNTNNNNNNNNNDDNNNNNNNSDDDDDDDDDDNFPTYSHLLINSSTASPRNSSLSLCRILQPIEKIPKNRHNLMLHIC